MDDTNLHDQLLAQLAEQQAAVEEIAALLAEDSTAELIQLHQELITGVQETQLALSDFEAANKLQDGPAHQSSSQVGALHRFGRLLLTAAMLISLL